jgi:hypothetical protein
MFSRTEREFLELLASAPAASVEELVRGRFPNPVYRRKLFWGIRRKASAAAADWALYRRAAEREVRVRPAAPHDPLVPVPTVTEPFAALVKRLHPARRPRADPTSGGGR